MFNKPSRVFSITMLCITVFILAGFSIQALPSSSSPSLMAIKNPAVGRLTVWTYPFPPAHRRDFRLVEEVTVLMVPKRGSADPLH